MRVRVIATRGAFWHATEASEGETSNAVMLTHPLTFRVAYIESHGHWCHAVVDAEQNSVGEFKDENYATVFADCLNRYFAIASSGQRAPVPQNDAKQEVSENWDEIQREADAMVERWSHAAEKLREAREALKLVAPPTAEHDNPLYYPLLFLCETVAPVLSELTDGAESGAAPLREEATLTRWLANSQNDIHVERILATQRYIAHCQNGGRDFAEAVGNSPMEAISKAAAIALDKQRAARSEAGPNDR